MKNISIFIYLFSGAILLIFFNLFILPKPAGFIALAILMGISTIILAFIFFKFIESRMTIPKTMPNGMISHDVKLSLKEIQTRIIIGCILSMALCILINTYLVQVLQPYSSAPVYLNTITAIPCFVYWYILWKAFKQSEVFSSIYIQNQRNVDKSEKKNDNFLRKKENETAIEKIFRKKETDSVFEKKSEEETIQSLERKIKIKELQRELDELQKEEKD